MGHFSLKIIVGSRLSWESLGMSLLPLFYNWRQIWLTEWFRLELPMEKSKGTRTHFETGNLNGKIFWIPLKNWKSSWLCPWELVSEITGMKITKPLINHQSTSLKIQHLSKLYFPTKSTSNLKLLMCSKKHKFTFIKMIARSEAMMNFTMQ